MCGDPPSLKMNVQKGDYDLKKNRLSSLKAFRFAEDPDNHRSSRVKQDWDQCSNNSDKNATKFSSFLQAAVLRMMVFPN